MQNKTFESIKENKLFVWIDPAFISKLKINQENFLSYKKGCIIYRINDESDLLYLVVEGTVKLKNYLHQIPGSSDSVVIKIKNDFFGEKEIIYRSPRSSVAMANSDCLLYGLPIGDLPKYLTRKLFYLNNAAFPDQEYFPKENNTQGSGKAFYLKSGSSRFFRVEPPGKMEYYRELQVIPSYGSSPAEKEISLNQTTGTIIQKDDVNAGYEFNKSDEPAVSLFNGNDIEAVSKLNEPEYISKEKTDYKVLESGIRKITEALIKISSSENKISSLLAESALLIDCEKCDLFIADTASNELTRWSAPGIRPVKFKIGLGITGTAAERKEILFSNDLKCDPQFIPEYEEALEIENKSILCLPLIGIENIILAVLRFINKRTGEFTVKDKSFLNIFYPFFRLAIGQEISSVSWEKNEPSLANKIALDLKYDLREIFHSLRTYSGMLRKMDLGTGLNKIVEMMYLQADCGEEYLISLAEFPGEKLPMDLQSTGINALLEGTLKTLAGFAASKNAALLKKFGAERKIIADKRRFHQACFHIIKNLCRDMPNGGKIYVKTEIEEEAVVIDFTGSSVQFYPNSDTNILESFNPGRNISAAEFSFPGSIIKKMGGSLEANKSVQGTSVSVSFPLYEKFAASNLQI